ncbi:MAG: hypothetical protein ACRDSZ_20180 [Pseudonocardiaceae bacterium]
MPASDHPVRAAHAGLEYREVALTTADLVPNYLTLDQLYLRLFVVARRFCAGERMYVFW